MAESQRIQPGSGKEPGTNGPPLYLIHILGRILISLIILVLFLIGEVDKIVRIGSDSLWTSARKVSMAALQDGNP